jgi:hypothetical protein
MKQNKHYIIIGICCGILLGLSLSPVIEKTLGILLVFITSLLGVASGVSINSETKDSKFKVNPLPLSLIMIGIVLGSFLGIFIRNKNVLGNDANINNVTLKKDPIQNIEEKTYTGLNGFEEGTPCGIIKDLHGIDLKNELEEFHLKKIDDCLKINSDSSSLEIIKIMYCQ